MADEVKITELDSGTVQLSDVYPAVDVLDDSQSDSGSTKKYILSDQFSFLCNLLGFPTFSPCYVSTISNLNATYNNGTSGVGATLTNAGTQAELSLDGFALLTSYIVLVKNQSSPFQNGAYIITNIGSSSTNWVLTRITTWNQSSFMIDNSSFFVECGDTNNNTFWRMTSRYPITVGTTDISFEQFNIFDLFPAFTWTDVISSTQQMNTNTGYINNNSTLVTYTLPPTSSPGDELRIIGKGVGGWGVVLNSGQSIRIGSSVTTSTTGSIASSDPYDAIHLVCTTANTVWTSSEGPQSSSINFDTL